jgi:hypothetical protein
MVWIGLHGIMFLFLFADFYKQSYSVKQKRLKEQKDASTNGKIYSSDDSSQMVSSFGNFCVTDVFAHTF